MKADTPESLNLDGGSFFTAVLQQAIALCGVAERQQGQDLQPDARLAVAHCLQAAYSRLCSGLPFEPAPPQCIMLVEVASRVMASFAAAPDAASAASVLLPPISKFLYSLRDSAQKCAQKLDRARRSLLASAELVLEGPQPLLSATRVAVCGPVLVGEAAVSVFYANHIAVWATGTAMTFNESRLAAGFLQQCVALLADSTIATQLKKQHCYPIRSLGTAPQLAVHLDCLAESASTRVSKYMGGLITATMCIKSRMKMLADNQQQLLALSAALARAAHMHGPDGELQESVQRPAASTYAAAALLANIAGVCAESMHHNAPLVCQPGGLAATLASGAVAALAWAVVDSSCGSRAPEIADDMPGCMQYAAHAAEYMHALAQQLQKPSRTDAHAARTALTMHGAAQSLVQLLLWLSDPATAVATASGVLAEALPALRLMAAEEDMRQVLAAAGGPHEWEPVAAALQRRLPRRMAARFLPEVGRVSAAVIGGDARVLGGTSGDTAAIAAAEAAMAELLQVRAIHIFCKACRLI